MQTCIDCKIVYNLAEFVESATTNQQKVVASQRTFKSFEHVISSMLVKLIIGCFITNIFCCGFCATGLFSYHVRIDSLELANKLRKV